MYSIFVVVAVPVSARKHTDRLITVDPGRTLFGADAPAINDNYQRIEAWQVINNALWNALPVLLALPDV
jgi:hypothetical protein